MGKFKPHKGLLKRIRITKSGKIKGRVANGSHLRSGKTSTRLRHMGKPRYFANTGVLRRVTHLLGRRVEPARETAAEARAADASPSKATKTKKGRKTKRSAASSS